MNGEYEPKVIRDGPILDVQIGSESDLATHLAPWAQGLQIGHLVIMQGEMGAGKTAIIRAIAPFLGVTDPVRSPTFSLIHRYQGRIPVLHADLYRLDGKPLQELLDDMPDALTFVEWGDESLARIATQSAQLLWVETNPNGRRIRVWNLTIEPNTSK